MLLQLFLRLHRSTKKSENQKFLRYKVAGFEIFSEFKIRFLEPYASNPTHAHLIVPLPPIRFRISNPEVEINTVGQLANLKLPINAIYDKQQCELVTKEFGSYLINKNEIYCFDTELVNAEMLFGPCFAICAIFNHQFHFHGSAILKDGQAVLFLGRSGSGKSTLAQHLNQHHPDMFERMSDDIIPTEFNAGKFCVRPHFPQLKLPSRQQYTNPVLDTCTINSIFILNSAENHQDGINLQTSTLVEASMECIKYSVASVLFSPKLLKRHFDYISPMVKKIPVSIINYPHSTRALPETAKLLLSLT